MKKIFIILIAILFSKSANAQLVNQGFELTAPGSYTTANAVSGWTVESRKANGTCSYTNWAPGSPEFYIVATPLTNWPNSSSPISLIPHSPLGGTVVAQLNNATPDTIMTRLKQTFVVNSWQSTLYFAYAGYWENASGHGCCDRPGPNMRLYDCSGAVLACQSLSLLPGPGCQSAGVDYTTTSLGHSWSNWQVKAVDLSQYTGTCVTVEFMSTDCSHGTHLGTTLLDVKTYGQYLDFLPIIPMSTVTSVNTGIGFCPNSNSVMLVAPAGYASYQWIAPSTGNVPLPQGTMNILAITNPVPASVYSLNLFNSNGCMYTKTYTLSHTQTSIAAIGSQPSCPNGASGSASVVAIGSGSGYAYSWTNSLTAVVGTQSVATGLSPGNYTVTVSGPSGSSCGTATAAVSVGSKVFQVFNDYKPFCGTQAFLSAPLPGNNYQWYNNGVPITGSLSTASSYTANNACNGCIYQVVYDASTGCRDSVQITTVATSPGSLSVVPGSIKAICVSANNGSLTLNLNGSGANNTAYRSFIVNSTGTTAPYTATSGVIYSNNFNISGLSEGSYSVHAFDENCAYTTTFAINPVSFSFSVNVASDTVCVGSSVSAGISFSSPPAPMQYAYLWSPTSWLFGNGQAIQLITPIGVPQHSSSTTIYTVMVTPSVAPCPQTKTIAVTAANPTVYSIAVPPGPLCDISSSQVLTVQPTGGNFLNSTLSPGLVGNAGIISPSNAIAGINSFTYEVKIGPCSASKSSTLLVSHFVPAQLTSPILKRCVDSPPFDLLSIQSNSTAGAWSGPGVQNNLFSTNTLQPGAYTLTYNTWSHPDPAACPDTTLLPATVAVLPPVSASSGSVCAGENFTISSSGAYSYSYSSGSGVVKPSANTSYSVWGLSIEGCKSPSAAVINISVVPSPTLNITSTNTLICEGDTVILSASGALTYSWNNGPASPVYSVSPAFTTMYIVTGTLGECKATAYYLQNVSPCTFLSDQKDESQVLIFPNPFSEVIYLQTNGIDKNSLLEITDNSGRVLVLMPLELETNTIQLGQLPKGLYHLRVSSKDNGVRTMRMIKQ